MFYEVDKIESNLICPHCNDRFKTPRILPCGKNMCQNCVDDLCESLKKQTPNDDEEIEQRIKCPLCKKKHRVPEEGFILNEFIVKTLELKPQKVYR